MNLNMQLYFNCVGQKIIEYKIMTYKAEIPQVL